MSTAATVQKQASAFLKDVITGLNASPKYLQSKYFYDAKGDALFQQIMQCREYYLTRCEMEILSRQSGEMAEVLSTGEPFDLIELGAGDASKSYHLLKELLRRGTLHRYYPIDISANIIAHLENTLPARLPGLKMEGLNGDYLDMLQQTRYRSGRKRVIMFMGSSIGNFTSSEALQFCCKLRQQMIPGDVLIIGFDLKKHPLIILPAYNDSQGITKAFNLNLLHRINRELDANFNTDNFEHYPVYDPQSGSCKSYLISLQEQVVHIGGGMATIRFRKDEQIYMEISQKYTVEEIHQMMESAGFSPMRHFYDSKRWFTDTVWQCL